MKNIDELEYFCEEGESSFALDISEEDYEALVQYLLKCMKTSEDFSDSVSEDPDYEFNAEELAEMLCWERRSDEFPEELNDIADRVREQIIENEREILIHTLDMEEDEAEDQLNLWNFEFLIPKCIIMDAYSKYKMS